MLQQSKRIIGGELAMPLQRQGEGAGDMCRRLAGTSAHAIASPFGGRKDPWTFYRSTRGHNPMRREFWSRAAVIGHEIVFISSPYGNDPRVRCRVLYCRGLLPVQSGAFPSIPIAPVALRRRLIWRETLGATA